MPKKIRQLIRELEQACFVNRGGKGSHRNFVHPDEGKAIVISGQLSDDGKTLSR
jgi:predicted RNA binding protein YcfA (HicA-like mRNA interferase family)